MSGRRVAALVRRVVAEIRRDRPSLALLFLAPILLTGLVSFILRESQTPAVSVAIVDGGAPNAAILLPALATALRDGGATVETGLSDAAARAAVGDGSVSLELIAGRNDLSEPAIIVVTRGLDAPADSAQIGTVQRALASAVAGATGQTPPAVEHRTIYGTPTDDPVASFAPAIVGFFAYFFVYVLTGVSFLRERTGGTLERLLATPVTRGEIVAGYTMGFGLFATIQVIVLLAWALGTVHVPAIGPLPAFAVGLGIPAAGSPVLAFLVVLLLAVGAVSLGIFLSTFARTELQIIQFIPIVLAPQFLLSGVIFPVSTLPSVLQPLVGVMPLNYAVDGLRQVFIRGADLGVAALQLDLAVLGAIAVLFGVLAALTIRRDVV
ncbi:MAG TPA: ABC transporter permease [Candidatus Limnocylindrales bacterium]|nr:ABC transporter permease [Candidatus Limnocylindrales bacterium]